MIIDMIMSIKFMIMVITIIIMTKTHLQTKSPPMIGIDPSIVAPNVNLWHMMIMIMLVSHHMSICNCNFLYYNDDDDHDDDDHDHDDAGESPYVNL